MVSTIRIIACAYLLFLSGYAGAIPITLEPTTWYEITSESGATLTVQPNTLRIGTAPFQARAFWEFSTLPLLSTFESISLAELTVSNIGRTHVVQLLTYPADAVPTTDDFNANPQLSDTSQVAPLFGFDDPFSRGPSNVFDITLGTQVAFVNNYNFLGVMIWAPSPSGVDNTFSEVLAGVDLRVTGTALPISVPEPTTLALFGIGLVGLGFTHRRKPA